jgi:hypothetical protein
MPAKKDSAGTLAESMVRVLEEQRRFGSGAYPLSLCRLAELTDRAADPELIANAAKKKPFGARIVVARAKDLDSPVALAEDAQLLAESWRTLEYLLTALCTPAEPTCNVARLKKLLTTKLKKPFEAEFKRRLAANDWPAGVLALVKQKAIYLDKFPPPPPPEVALASELVRVLEGQKRLGDGSYPLTFGRLVELARPQASPEAVQKAVAQPAFDRVIIALAFKGKQPKSESPVALAEDKEALADWPPLIEAAMKLTRADDKPAVTTAELKKKIASSLAPTFDASLSRRLKSNTLPPGIGSLTHGKNKHLVFFLSDVRSSQSTAANVPPAIAGRPAASTTAAVATDAGFARAFDDAFDQLDRQRGHNFVSLVDLRRAVRADRQSFDAGLQAFRRANRYTLSGGEGRDGFTREQRDAGIEEEGSLLLYVSRRLP